MLDLVEGLRYLHEEASIIHRNIRGQSILIKGGRYVISDFS
jgi:serine/threonine protein kinase